MMEDWNDGEENLGLPIFQYSNIPTFLNNMFLLALTVCKGTSVAENPQESQ